MATARLLDDHSFEQLRRQAKDLRDLSRADLQGALDLVGATIPTAHTQCPWRARSFYDLLGHDLRTAIHYPPGHQRVLDCAYQAGLAYAEARKPDLALPQFQFYARNAGTVTAQVFECRYMIAQMLLARGDPDEALAELQSIRDLIATHDGHSARRLADIDKQIARLKRRCRSQRCDLNLAKA